MLAAKHQKGFFQDLGSEENGRQNINLPYQNELFEIPNWKLFPSY
jgi:hypothetical protein